MKKIIFATNNNHKLEEVRTLLSDSFEVLSLKDINCTEDIPETGTTLEENALLKARYVKEKFGFDCFADDTGLEVIALNNEPGVYSARYAGEAKDATNNMHKVLHKLQNQENRLAQFRTVIALIYEEKEYLFDGIIVGSITDAPKGESGFGYDPIFKPDGYDITFAQMDITEKNKISHRGLAISKLYNFFKQK